MKRIVHEYVDLADFERAVERTLAAHGPGDYEVQRHDHRLEVWFSARDVCDQSGAHQRVAVVATFILIRKSPASVAWGPLDYLVRVDDWEADLADLPNTALPDGCARKVLEPLVATLLDQDTADGQRYTPCTIQSASPDEDPASDFERTADRDVGVHRGCITALVRQWACAKRIIVSIEVVPAATCGYASGIVLGIGPADEVCAALAVDNCHDISIEAFTATLTAGAGACVAEQWQQQHAGAPYLRRVVLFPDTDFEADDVIARCTQLAKERNP